MDMVMVGGEGGKEGYYYNNNNNNNKPAQRPLPQPKQQL
jgi:hypothetical protein